MIPRNLFFKNFFLFIGPLINLFLNLDFSNLKAISKSYFINLDRRTDRLHHMLINTPFFTERFSAVDSKQMQLTDEVKKLFPKTKGRPNLYY